MSKAVNGQKAPRAYTKHGDSTRQRLLKERGTKAIDGRSRSGLRAKAWRRYAQERKGGKACPIDIREKIEAGCFYLWRALELRAWIAADARKRGTPINRRSGKLPAINAQYDTAIEQWQKINDALDLGKGGGLDLARRLAEARNNGMTR